MNTHLKTLACAFTLFSTALIGSATHAAELTQIKDGQLHLEITLEDGQKLEGVNVHVETVTKNVDGDLLEDSQVEDIAEFKTLGTLSTASSSYRPILITKRSGEFAVLQIQQVMGQGFLIAGAVGLPSLNQDFNKSIGATVTDYTSRDQNGKLLSKKLQIRVVNVQN